MCLFPSHSIKSFEILLAAVFVGSFFASAGGVAQAISVDSRECVIEVENRARLPVDIEDLIRSGKIRNLSKVIGADDRVPLTDTTAFPYRAIGLILTEVDTGEETIYYAGTGTLIGTKTVLTCADNLVDDNLDGWADFVTFIPGKDCDYEPYGRFYAVRLVAPEAFWQDDESYDIGMFVLDEPIGQSVGYMEIEVLGTDVFDYAKINMAGYPSDLGDCSSLYGVFGSSYGVVQGLIRHDLDSQTGQSGAPVWIYDSSQEARSIVAVHILGGDEYNYAVRISDTFFDWINDYLKENDTVWYEDATEPVEVTPRGGISLCGSGAVVPLVLTAVGLLGLCLAGRRRPA